MSESISISPSEKETVVRYEEHLSRDLGLFSVTMIGVGAMIGAGIFVLTGLAAGAAGPALIVAFALNGVVTLLTAMVYAELGSSFPDAGGGYLWVKEGLPQPMGFFSGWMSWFAHAVACSLYALGFGAYFGEVISELGLTPAALSPHMLIKVLAVGMIALFTYINYRGASETGAAGNFVTVAKIVVIALFVFFGFRRMMHMPGDLDHFTPFFPNGYSGVFIAMGLTFIAFEGYEIIAQCAEEVVDYKKNIPRAVFLSLAIVVPIYILVAIVAVGAVHGGEMPAWKFLGIQKETAMVDAARQFMPYGALILLVGGLLSTMSALNATIYSSSRVSFAMARDHNLPDILGLIHRIKRTPHGAIVASGLIIAAMAIALPIEDVASAADIMFLLLFLLVNMTAIKLRRNRPDLERHFRIPLFPYVPILAIISQLFLALYMFNMSPIAWFTVIGWIGAGLVFYYAYSFRKETERVKTPVVFEEREVDTKAYHVLVPLSKREEVLPLMTFAGAIAKARDGDIHALSVVEVPEQLPITEGKRFISGKKHILEVADKFGESQEVPVHIKVRVTHRPHLGILDTIREEKTDIVVMGWKGYTLAKDKLLGQTLDPLTRNAPCDLAVVKLREIEKIESIFVPTAGGPHAEFAFTLAKEIAAEQGARLVVGTVIPAGASEERQAQALQVIDDLISESSSDHVQIEKKVLSSDSVVAALIKESNQHSLTLIGASNQSLWEQLRLGSVPETISRRSAKTVVIVRKYEGRIKSWVRRFFSG
jgi:amino acid transporter/nucleotide-binding universal stress UspA family protein